MKNALKKMAVNLDESIYIQSRRAKVISSKLTKDKCNFLRENGYVIFDHLVGSSIIERLASDINQKADNFRFRKPLLAQARVDSNKHKKLIESNFLLNRIELPVYDIDAQFKKNETLLEFVKREKPSSLEFEMPDVSDFYNVWLDDEITKVVEMYFGFTPILAEAFVRRNYPSEFIVMNHGWHSDKNHDEHLLKGFIFLNDCDLNNGPHHYLEKTHRLEGLEDKSYFSEEEIEKLKNEKQLAEIVSIVPKGTIIIEDTRGLHKAGLPKLGYRDLGFSTFLPDRFIKKRNVDYSISLNTFNNLTQNRKKWVKGAR